MERREAVTRNDITDAPFSSNVCHYCGGHNSDARSVATKNSLSQGRYIWRADSAMVLAGLAGLCVGAGIWHGDDSDRINRCLLLPEFVCRGRECTLECYFNT